MDQAGREPRGHAAGAIVRLAGSKISPLDFVIALGREVGGSCAPPQGPLHVRLHVRLLEQVLAFRQEPRGGA